MESRTVGAFYDDYVGRQSAVGINERHRAIMGWLMRFGLRPTNRVLELGCGVGTLTQLLAEALSSEGTVVGVDLSPKSIEAARARLSGLKNVRLIAGDALDIKLDGTPGFDVVVLPDVIEHIPLEQHGALFDRVASWLAPGGFVLLHYPSPRYLEWCSEHNPELLQVIDQPIHADVLLANTAPRGLVLDHLETYSIWIREGDYVVAVLRPSGAVMTFTEVRDRRPGLVSRVRRRIRRVVT
jgi:SAM-dependent methyltransferase